MREFVQVPPGFRQMLEELADLAVLLLDELDGDVEVGGSTADFVPMDADAVAGAHQGLSAIMDRVGGRR